MHYRKTQSLIISICILHLGAFAQISPARLQQYVSQNKYGNSAALQEFYSTLNYKTAWIQKENVASLAVLQNDISSSSDHGLRVTDYDVHNLQNTEDSLMAEVRITDAAIRFYTDIAYGNSRPSLGYNGLQYSPGCNNIPQMFAASILKAKLNLLISQLSPTLPEIRAIENNIRSFNRIMHENNFKEVIITSSTATAANIPLLTKLYQLGIIDSLNKHLPDSIVIQKIKEAQRRFNLLADGLLRSTCLKELNIPLSTRLQQLIVSVNNYRWLYCLIQNQAVIVVSIPAAYLKVYKNNEVLLEMRVIVGKPSTPTPTLASRIGEVILYPYWHVPYSIATKELLPAVKRNPGYINAGNYQVLNMAGKIVDPHSINWKSLSSSYFPYIIRQSTGCDNALGLLKLNFYSPFGVYLHDTPNKNLFTLNKRYFSHGCMRMEKPMEIGHLILKNNPIAIDTLEQKGCLRNQSPITVKADENMPVIVWYNPAGIDPSGRILFYEDVYKKFAAIKIK